MGIFKIEKRITPPSSANNGITNSKIVTCWVGDGVRVWLVAK